MDYVNDQRPAWSPEEAIEFLIACATADLVHALNIPHGPKPYKHLLLVVLPDPVGHPRDYVTTTGLIDLQVKAISEAATVHYLGFMDEHVIHATSDVQP